LKDPKDLLLRCLDLYSPTGMEGPLANYLLRAMKEMGYRKVRLDGAGNAIGETGRGGPHLLLCGHMDTVPGRLPVRVEGDTVYGRGAADAKAPLCSLLLAGSRLSDAPASITFAGVTGEESDSHGVRTIAESRKKFDFAVFGEPGGYQRITVGYRGRVGLHLKINTSGGHAGSPWAHRSAFDEFNSLLKLLADYASAHTVAGDHFRSVSVTPTVVRAGEYHNVVPASCEATIDVRVPPGMSAMKVASDLAEIAKKGSTPGSTVSVNFDSPTEPYEADPNSVLVRSFQRSIIAAGGKPSLIRKTGTGDMNDIAAAKGVQCITYGPGDSSTSHTDGERVSVQDYLKSIEVTVGAVMQLLKLTDY